MTMPRAGFEQLDGLVVVVGPSCAIEEANSAWAGFMARFGPEVEALAAPGSNYNELCAWWLGPDPDQCGRIASALQDVIAGKLAHFAVRFRAFSHPDLAEFLLQAVPRGSGGVARAVLVHNSVSELRSVLERTVPLDDASAPLSSAMRVGALAEFERLATVYDSILDRAILQRAYKVESTVSGELRTLAAELGYRNARPRDLIDLHKTVFQKKCQGLAPGSAMVLLDEARLALLEVMGHLASYYRDFSAFTRYRAGARPAPPEEESD